MEVELIPVPAPATSVSVTLWDRFTGWLATPIAKLCLALALFVAPIHAQIFNPSVIPAPSQNTLRHGMNYLATGTLVNATGSNVQYFSWTEPADAKFVSVIVNSASANALNATFFSVREAVFDPGVSGAVTQGWSAFRTACQSDYGAAGGAAVAIVAFCSPAITGQRVLGITLTTPQIVNLLVYVSDSPMSAANKTICFHAANDSYLAAGGFVACDPVDLGMFALTLPASGSTALSNIIDTRGAHSLMLLGACTQTANLNIAVYAEDGVTALFGGAVQVTSGGFSNVGLRLSDQGVAATNATVMANVNVAYLPQRALAFSFTNSTATLGSCTARLFLGY